MTLRTIALLFTMILSAGTLLAEGKISFETMRHDFGTVQESDGDITCQFVFRNTGDSPLLITRCTASCGCTTPEYPRKPLRPGDKGVITVTYHSKGRPGPFEKSVYVFTNDGKKERNMLLITGNVISNSSRSETYSTVLGAGLRAKLMSLNFFDVYPGRTPRTRTLQVYNENDESIRLTFRNVPRHLVIDVEPEVIQPKREGRVMITYLTDKVKDWGLREDVFDLYVKGHETQMKQTRVSIMADIWEDFSKLSKKDKAVAPEAEISEQLVDFGHTGAGKSATHQFTLRNTGHSKLSLRKLQLSDNAIFRAQADRTTIKPGETATITVTCTMPATGNGKANGHLVVITNDPSNSRIIVNLKASR